MILLKILLIHRHCTFFKDIFHHLSRPTLCPKYKTTPIQNNFISIFKIKQHPYKIIFKSIFKIKINHFGTFFRPNKTKYFILIDIRLIHYLSRPTKTSNLTHWLIDYKCTNFSYSSAWRQKIAILISMQFLNDIIKSRHGFKTAQKFHKFRVFFKTLNLWNFWTVLKPCLDLMMSFKNCICIRIAIFWRHAEE